MHKLMNEKIPQNPCTDCVPPKRNADCHAKCRDYLEWEAKKNLILQARWKYKESTRYISNILLRNIKRNQMGK